ncbi:glycosyltransferase [Solitalea koreensis]|uniref:Glycosyltransferase involved in cell wall bisynthesis n=1 Tax=Solitalea koreensis TaxID=543615 RepID=A0A521CIQ1_9SPHI|nr:glycosyltransferase [Solitalea koreensis]SMO58621.1 Glycosyltransferase involved in cell wall bisynthesis [Solitalea koreensis]
MTYLQPLVSIALCSYNGAKFIIDQINSIQLQTYPNLEIIIVDDCSTDNTWNLVTNLAAEDSRIKAYKNEVNIGFNKNFEKAISLCSGDYIAISDQDDIWMPIKIDTLVKNIGDKGVIFSNSQYIDEQGQLLNKYLLYDFNLSHYQCFKSILLHNILTGHTTMFRKKFSEQLLPIPQNGYYDWWLAFIGIYNNELIYLNEVLTYYRIHANSVIQKEAETEKRIGRQALRLKIVKTQIKAFLEYKRLTQNDREFLMSFYESHNTIEHKSFIFNIFMFKNFFSLYPDRRRKRLLSNVVFFIKKCLNKNF